MLLGCNLVDTSPSFNDGKSEAMVGKVLNELFASKKLQRDVGIHIVQRS